jgi:hypothetical protein
MEKRRLRIAVSGLELWKREPSVMASGSTVAGLSLYN